MRRLFAVVLIVGVVWIANLVLPPGNDDAQLRPLTTSTSSTANTSGRPQTAAPAKSPSPAHSQISAPAAGFVNDGMLIVQVQEQLRRVGCYRGAIDGKWNAATRRAMARFNEHAGIQAALDLPTASQLPLLGAYGGRACGTPCPGESRPDAQGYCATVQSTAAKAPAAEEVSKPTDAPLRVAIVAAVVASPAPALSGLLQNAPPTSAARKAAAAALQALQPTTPQPAEAAPQVSVHPDAPVVVASAPADKTADGPVAGVLDTVQAALAPAPVDIRVDILPVDPPAPAKHKDAIAVLAPVPASPLAAPASLSVAIDVARRGAAPAAVIALKHKLRRKPLLINSQVALASIQLPPPALNRHTTIAAFTAAYGFGGGAGASGGQPLTIVLSKR